jgi:hypothetical protein
MIRKIVLVLVMTTFNTHALDLFNAQYDVFKDGKKIGKSSIALSQDAPFYKITDKTNGTHGMASFLGFKRTEETLFTANSGLFSPDSYQMNQKVAFNKRHSDYQIDKETHMVYGKHKGDEWQSKLPSTFYTPNLVSLKLFEDICGGKTSDLNYPVLKSGKIQNYQFKITSHIGSVIEVDKIHAKTTRVTKTWLDTKQHCIPVRTYHKEKGEDALESTLTKATFF